LCQILTHISIMEMTEKSCDTNLPFHLKPFPLMLQDS
jgi:hypothetical protein